MKVIQNMDTEEVTVTYISTHWNHQKQLAHLPILTSVKLKIASKVVAGCNYPKCVGLDSRWRGL